jgi:MscS family membrane protein
VGEPLVVQLKRILDRHALIDENTIHNDPKGAPYVVLKNPQDPTGRKRIEIVPVLLEGSNAVEWKFSQSSLAILDSLWDNHYKSLPLVVELASPEQQVLSLDIRDWVVDNAAFLMEAPFVFENWKWLGMFISILLGMIISRITTAILLRIIRRIFREEKLRLDEKLEKGFVRPVRIGIMAWVWWLAIKPLMLPEVALLPLKTVIITISSSAFVWSIYRLVDIVGSYIGEKARLTDNKYDDLVVPLIVRSLKIFVLFIGFIFVCQMNDWKYQTALAGFGLVGMATALAAKDTLGNVFGSLTVLVDRPFQIGDWIQIGDVDGSVESVGIRSARIRTFYNSMITVPNQTLTNAIIDNYGARQYRRLKMDVAITYDTPPEKIEAFCEGIRELIRQHPYTRKDYFHVYLNTLGDSSLNILLYCFHECPEWSTELRERHRMLLDIIRLAHSMGVEFAFPTSTLYMQANIPGDPISIDQTKSLQEGRRLASEIVQEHLGENKIPPPPVTFDAPPGAVESDNE